MRIFAWSLFVFFVNFRLLELRSDDYQYEKAGFNQLPGGAGADGNADGIADHLQSEVAGIPVSTDVTTYASVYQVLEVIGGNCAVIDAAEGKKESVILDDSSIEFPFGLVSYTLRCFAPGDTATLKVTYNSQAIAPSASSLKKFVGSVYQDLASVSGITVTQSTTTATVGTTPVTTYTFTITDGQAGDTDGVMDGDIEKIYLHSKKNCLQCYVISTENNFLLV
jgi:hypothetical protein